MSSATRRCDRILSLIDDCLADHEESQPPSRRSSAPLALVPDATWSRLVPTGHPLRDFTAPTAA
jgi:hypothetical protein